jgi:lipopolysaccharide/colanic/teichoic acid biosynthesis glycosyltransferase
VGKDGREFTFYKFRSMHTNADLRRNELAHLNETDGPVFKMREDPRITAVGRILRRTSIDEAPQFWNVLRGDMSLVGPRPPLPSEVMHYDAKQWQRLMVWPGITCIWQVSGRSDLDFATWVDMDLEYIRRWSPWLDVALLLRTIPAVLSGRGAY